jgi:large subunit ribosomal protein L17
MRHKIAHRKLNRTSEHRKALFKNMLNSLIKHEQIKTTLPKAKELKPLIDKVITIGKKKDLSARRSLISKLQDETSAEKLITVLSKRLEKAVILELLEQEIVLEIIQRWRTLN